MLRVFLILVLWSAAASAVERVSVLALFPGKAMLDIDGQRKVLSDGQGWGDDFRLIRATPGEARVMLNGSERVLKLGNAVRADYARAEKQEIRLLKQQNAFYIDGLINGQPTRMLVDTGATHVAMSERTARSLGIPYVRDGRASGVRTASGSAAAYDVRLKSLKLGNNTFSNVRAMVVEGDSPTDVLLGMNVLGRFEIEQQNNLMVLRTR